MEKEEINAGLGKLEESFQKNIKAVAEKFLDVLDKKKKEIFLISHFDTDGITSASIMIKALKKLDKRFTVKIVKSLEESTILEIPKDKVVLFLDLASGSLDYIKKAGFEDVFIIDHHEIPENQNIPDNITIINPMLSTKEKISSAGLVYLFCKELNPDNKNLAKLAILGMIGDIMEESIGKLGEDIFSNEEVNKKQGLLIYPSTRPVNRALEYCSQPYIPGVTGNSTGVLEMLREVGIEPVNGKYKSLIELNDKEMKNLVGAIMLRNPKAKHRDVIGNIFLLKFFNKLDDSRELSAMINACSRLGESTTALKFCMEIEGARKEAEAIHVKYKQHIVSGLNHVSKMDKIEGKGFVIIHAEDNIKDTIVGTIASILSKSSLYEEGTVITTMAYYEDKIKVSARNVGREGRNVREILESVVSEVGGESGGHEFAAGCIVSRDKEKEFIESLKKNLEVELVKV
jgi:RecJ-like exonuclease